LIILLFSWRVRSYAADRSCNQNHFKMSVEHRNSETHHDGGSVVSKMLSQRFLKMLF